MNDSNYTVYHLHTEQSLLDSCTNYKLYVDKAKKLGQTAICFTEHGNLYNWYEKKMYCDENGIKYLHGIECYLTQDKIGSSEKHRDNYHTILIAKNMDGFKELNQLVFLSTNEYHKYYKPRITFDEFRNISDNIIKISACLASPLNSLRETEPWLLKKYDYYELQPHNFDKQIEYNEFLYKMAQKYNKPLIVGTDTHSINKYKAECRVMLQLGKTDGTFSDEDTFDLTYKTYDELVNMFKEQNTNIPFDVILDAINNTNIMAAQCEDIVIDTSVKYPICYGKQDEKVMWETLTKKYKEKVNLGIIDKSRQYIDNIKEEMRVFKKTNMIGFMLFMSEMISWCKENNIPTSPCRGSVGGSTVAFIGDIIDVDPIKWKTVFSRFCNEDRLEVGDIDCDFYEDDRPKVYEYIINRFGKDKTAYILSSGTVVDKGVIDLVGRALHNQWKQKMGYSKNDKSHDKESPYSLNIVSQIKEEYGVNPDATKEKYKELFYYFDGLLNTVVSQSQHPAGIVASPINLIENYSVFIGEDGQYILSINMEEVHEIGLVKYDILGLKNIGIIKKCCEYSNIPYPRAHEINWNDQNVYEDMVNSPIGIFQFEGKYAFELLSKFGVHNINDMSLVNASLRPSGESYRDRLISHEPNKNPSEIIDKLLEQNYGYLVFQEDTIAFLQQICGLSGSEADNVRRAIGRKQTDRLQKALPDILNGYCSVSNKPREVSEQEAKQFLQIIEDSSNYQFGYNHSTGYSMLGYLCAYMRYYHPKEFICAYLNCAKSEEDIASGTLLAHQKGIKIEMPKFRESLDDFRCDEHEDIIYKGLRSIKDIGRNNGSELYQLRHNNYETFIDLLYDIKKTSVNKKHLDILIKIGFFNEFGDINNLLFQVKYFDELYKCKNLKVEKAQVLKIPAKFLIAYSDKQTEKTYSGIHNRELLIELMSVAKVKPCTIYDKMKYQMELLGYTNMTNPQADGDLYLVENIESTSYNNFASLYRIYDGAKMRYKVNKRFYTKNPLQSGDIIQVIFEEKPKWKKVDDGFIKTGETEIVIKGYKKIN